MSKVFLKAFGIQIINHIIQFADEGVIDIFEDPQQIRRTFEESPVGCTDKKAETEVIQKIDQAKTMGDSLRGIFEIIVFETPIGLGSYDSFI